MVDRSGLDQGHQGARGLVLIPFPKKYKERSLEQELNLLLQKGYTRVQDGHDTLRIEEILDGTETRFDIKQPAHTFHKPNLGILIARILRRSGRPRRGCCN